MEKTIGIADARDGFAELVNRVAFGRERFVVERRGKPLAALISATEYHALLKLLGEVGISDEVRGIPVRIRFDGEQYFVSDDVLDLYGVGDTPEEAQQDYDVAMSDYYADLSANADHLAGHLQEHLVVLRRIFATSAGGQ